MVEFQSVVVEFNLKNHHIRTLSIEEFDISAHEPHLVYWINCNLNQHDKFAKLAEKLHLPDAVINLCHLDEVMPKLIETMDTLTLRVQCSMLDELNHDQEAEFANLIIHLTSRYCLTASYVSLPALLTFTESYSRAMKYARTSCFMFFLILDNIVNDFSNVLYDYELISDKLDSIGHDFQEDDYNTVTDKKNQVMKIKRYAVAIRDILMRISGKKIEVISEQCRQSLISLVDHSQMIIAEADAIRELLNGILGRIDNQLMQKMNNTMKVLTSFAAIFLPLTLIAGIYGMNFHWIPELEWKFGYFWALSLMVVCALVLFCFFKRKKWF